MIIAVINLLITLFYLKLIQSIVIFFDRHNVRHALKSVNVRKCSGLDGISLKLLRCCADSFVLIVLYGQFPSSSTHSCSTQRSLINGDRPVLLSCLNVKVLVH